MRLRSLSLRDLVRVPGLISLSRVPLAALFPLALGRPRRALGLLAIAGATDLVDGWYARTFHQQTTTGAIVDGITDKVFVLGVVGALARAGRLGAGEALMLGTRELGELALAVRLSADRRRRGSLREASANAGGKMATTLQYAALAAVIAGSRVRRALIAATAVAGIVASVAYWQREARRAGA
jgi:CDP-diacylglycerol--glycerol-3-phosphate 3-phosphatidyltransferase/cardiolipin synthase